MLSPILSLLVLVLADSSKLARDITAEFGRLDGRWQCTGMTVSGKPFPEKHWRTLGLTISGRSWEFTDHHTLVEVIDVRATPKRIELVDDRRYLELSQVPGRYLWVYTLDGDKLKASHNVSTGAFPARVDGGDKEQVTIEYRRVKKR